MVTTLGIDLGATNLKAVVLAHDVVAQRWVEPSPAHLAPQECIDRIAEMVRTVVSTYGVAHVGIGLPGPVDRVGGALVESPMLRGWKDVPVRDLIAAAGGLPVVVENDATCAVFGETVIGAGRGRSVVAGFTLGTGIGGGLVVDGRPFRGATGIAGEFGHVAVADAPDCPCGSRGCLHMLASASATVDRYASVTGDRSVGDVSTVIGKAVAGDSQAMAVLDATLDYLSRGVRAVINVLNPDVVVLCGGMAQCGVPLEERVLSRLEGTLFRSASQTAIRSALLGLHSGAVGAALLAAQEAQRS